MTRTSSPVFRQSREFARRLAGKINRWTRIVALRRRADDRAADQARSALARDRGRCQAGGRAADHALQSTVKSGHARLLPSRAARAAPGERSRLGRRDDGQYHAGLVNQTLVVDVPHARGFGPRPALRAAPAIVRGQNLWRRAASIRPATALPSRLPRWTAIVGVM